MEIKTTVVKDVIFSIELLKEILCKHTGFDLSKTQMQDLSEWDDSYEDHKFSGIKLTETNR